ncbi:MAG TPA: SH3 domain-containing protein [Azonexus sp.]|nr:SH3 domain-containing protein [Azonexus sp.]
MAMWCRAVASLVLIGAAGTALALDFRSVDVPAAILYDSPSQQGKKLYLIKAQTPVEVILRLEGMAKIRDAEGTLAWIEVRNLGERRTLVVTAPRAEIRQADKPDAPVLAELDKWVVVDFVEPAAPVWAKVRHRDGATGYVRATQVWGL